VRPDWARRGIARALLERCETEAAAHGFRSLELVATLPGLRLYHAFGYLEDAPIQHPLPDGTPIELVPMRKQL
jgi:GNAT superfamily N-acetyltransferase